MSHYCCCSNDGRDDDEDGEMREISGDDNGADCEADFAATEVDADGYSFLRPLSNLKWHQYCEWVGNLQKRLYLATAGLAPLLSTAMLMIIHNAHFYLHKTNEVFFKEKCMRILFYPATQ